MNPEKERKNLTFLELRGMYEIKKSRYEHYQKALELLRDEGLQGTDVYSVVAVHNKQAEDDLIKFNNTIYKEETKNAN